MSLIQFQVIWVLFILMSEDIPRTNTKPLSGSHQLFWSALVQGIDCHLISPSHYLDQWWHIVNKIIRNTSPCNFCGNDFDINSWWPSSTKWQHWSRPMAWCLTAPSHYLNQCWLFISEVVWHLHESNFTTCVKAYILYNGIEKYTLKLLPHLAEANELTHWSLGDAAIILNVESLSIYYRLSSWALIVKSLTGECYWSTELLWWWVIIGSGNGLVPSGNKPLTEIYVATWHHYTTMS